VKLRKDLVDHVSGKPSASLNEAGHGKNRKEAGKAGEEEPVLDICQFLAVQGRSGDPGQNEVDTAEADESGEAEDCDVGMGDHPIGKMGDLLHRGEGLERTLEADEKIPRTVDTGTSMHMLPVMAMILSHVGAGVWSRWCVPIWG
jgi:hypothetical protein